MLHPAPDPQAEIALLRRQLERERRARRTAEEVCEQSTAQLYDTVQELRCTEDRLRQHLEAQRLVHQLSLGLRLDLDPQGIVRRAVGAVGSALGADRCLVRLADQSGIGLISEQWAGPDAAPLPPGTTLPPALDRLCTDAVGTSASLVVDDVLSDARLSADEAAQVVGEVGALSYLGTPMWMADRLVGWLVLQSTTAARPWTAHQVAVVEGVADALGVALMQAEVHAGQAEALARLQLVDRAKSDFVATASHELRTPLTSISGYTQMLLDPDVTQVSVEQRHMLTVVDRNAHRLLNLLEDLLSLARVDGGHEPVPDPTRVDLLTVVDDVHRAMASLAERRGLEVRLSCPTTGPTVRGEAGQLERLVFNLVSNAIKFTPAGGLVTTTLTHDEGRTVLRVSDTGLGIPEAELPLVFDRFYRASVATEHAIQGTGLGLAVVRNIVEAHGGTVTIASEPGRGTTATVTLPTVRLAPVGDAVVGLHRTPEGTSDDVTTAPLATA